MKLKLRKSNFVLICLLLSYFLFENMPAIHQLCSNSQDELSTFKQFDDECLALVEEYSMQELLDGGKFLVAAIPRGQSQAELIVRKIIRGNIRRNNFGTALLMNGLLLSYEKNNGAMWRSDLDDYITSIIDSTGGFKEGIQTVDQCMVGYSLLGYTDSTHTIEIHQAIKSLHTFLVEKHVKSANGLIPYRSIRASLMYVDTLGMICPFLARYGSLHGVKSSQDLAFLHLDEFYRNAVDVKTGLPFHAYDENYGVGIGLRGWTRGVGWYCLGLVGTIEWLPADSRERAVLEGYLREIMSAVVKYQKKNGCWSWEICNMVAPDDTSGTAMIGYSMIRGCELGILDKSTYESNCYDVVNGILTYVNSQGKVFGTLGECRGIGKYPTLFGHASWGQGAVLMLLTSYNYNVNEGDHK